MNCKYQNDYAPTCKHDPFKKMMIMLEFCQSFVEDKAIKPSNVRKRNMSFFQCWYFYMIAYATECLCQVGQNWTYFHCGIISAWLYTKSIKSVCAGTWWCSSISTGLPFWMVARLYSIQLCSDCVRQSSFALAVVLRPVR